MIVSFLFLFNYLLSVVKTKKLKDSPSNNRPCIPDAIQLLNRLDFFGIGIFDDEVGVRFKPPAYSQRYQAICNILVQLQPIFDIKKLVDIGCAELSFFTFIKKLEMIEEYIGVDIDGYLLEKCKSRVSPLNIDYLSRRCSPLKVSILHGSAIDPDVRLKYANAIVAIELIEHMYPKELEDLPYTIFGVIQPEVAIFTTPNADFNVFFSRLKPNEFRHFDHKFEWSCQQFEDWGYNLVLRYPGYEVWFNGIARGPEGTEEFGCCSQIAVFLRKEVKIESTEFDDYYRVVHEVHYPYQTEEDKFKSILEYEVYQFLDRISDSDAYTVGDQIEIPLADIINYITVSCTEEKLKAHLEKCGKHVELKNNELKLILPPPSIASLSSLEEIIENLYHNNDDDDDHPHEGWINENNDFLNDFINDDENWSYVLGDVNEMKSGPNDDFDQIEDVRDLADEIDHLLRNSGNDGPQSSSKNINENDLLLPDEEDLRADSATPLGENQAQYLIADSILHISSSTGSGNTSKSSDTFVESSLSPKNTIGNSMNDETSENNALSTLKTSFSDQEPYPCSSSYNDAVDAPENIPDSFYHDDKPSSFDIPSVSRMEINKNEAKQNISIPSPISETPFKEPDDVIEESSNTKEVHHDQSSSLVTRSQSLENVNMKKCKDKCFRYSLNIDNKIIDCDTSVVDMDLDTCKRSSIPSLTETYGSLSKAVDSGYPNSTQDMELDLTPEQVDEIITETESSLEDEESSADERVEPVHGNPPLVFADNVENGDVANNNRDGEGNNMEGGQILQEELILEDLVIGGDEVEAADGHESDDDGLFLSALDASNDTVVPEEMSSNDDTVYLFDLPSLSSFGSLLVEPSISSQNQNQFPSWLLSMEVWDEDNGSGDAGPDRDEDSSDLVVDREGQVDFYPGDTRAGGEPTLPDD